MSFQTHGKKSPLEYPMTEITPIVANISDSDSSKEMKKFPKDENLGLPKANPLSTYSPP